MTKHWIQRGDHLEVGVGATVNAELLTYLQQTTTTWWAMRPETSTELTPNTEPEPDEDDVDRRSQLCP